MVLSLMCSVSGITRKIDCLQPAESVVAAVPHVQKLRLAPIHCREDMIVLQLIWRQELGKVLVLWDMRKERGRTGCRLTPCGGILTWNIWGDSRYSMLSMHERIQLLLSKAAPARIRNRVRIAVDDLLSKGQRNKGGLPNLVCERHLIGKENRLVGRGHVGRALSFRSFGLHAFVRIGIMPDCSSRKTYLW